jgi:gentisate 1,2-dioxygenase
MKRLVALIAAFSLLTGQAFAGTVYLTEFGSIPVGPAGVQIQVAVEPPFAEQTLTSSGASASSVAVNAQTRIVRITTDSIICVVSGTGTVTATTGKRRMAADTVEYFAVPLNAAWKFAVITCT